MALERARTRARSARLAAGRGRGRRTAMSGRDLDTSVLPRVIVGAVNGLEIVAVGALRITRDVLIRTISGAAAVGAEALTAATGAVRGIVSAASRTIGLGEPSMPGATETTAVPSAAATRRPRGRARAARTAHRSTRAAA